MTLVCRGWHRDDVKELAKLLAENPGYTEADIKEGLEYYRAVVGKKVAADHDLKKEFPQLNFKQACVMQRDLLFHPPSTCTQSHPQTPAPVGGPRLRSPAAFSAPWES